MKRGQPRRPIEVVEVPPEPLVKELIAFQLEQIQPGLKDADRAAAGVPLTRVTALAREHRRRFPEDDIADICTDVLFSAWKYPDLSPAEIRAQRRRSP